MSSAGVSAPLGNPLYPNTTAQGPTFGAVPTSAQTAPYGIGAYPTAVSGTPAAVPQGGSSTLASLGTNPNALQYYGTGQGTLNPQVSTPIGYLNTQGVTTAGLALQGGVPQIGEFGANTTQGDLADLAAQKNILELDPNYANYEQLATQAQQAQGAGQQVLNTSGVPQAAQVQQSLVDASQTQQAATNAQMGAIGNLQTAAQGGGPMAGSAAQQAGTQQAIQQQMAAANSARGGFGLANAQKQAQATGAGLQQQAVQQGAIMNLQQQEAAQANLANATGQAVTGANQATSIAGTNAANAAGTLGQQEALAMGYYGNTAGLYNAQAGTAAGLAQSQLAANAGASNISAQTGTQAQTANNQLTWQGIGAGASLATGLIAAAASTGGAEAGALGAMASGAPPHVAAEIGARVGHAIGQARGGSALPAREWAFAKEADRQAAMSVAHGSAQPQGAFPGPESEPLAPAAYRAGAALARRPTLAALMGVV